MSLLFPVADQQKPSVFSAVTSAVLTVYQGMVYLTEMVELAETAESSFTDYGQP